VVVRKWRESGGLGEEMVAISSRAWWSGCGERTVERWTGSGSGEEMVGGGVWWISEAHPTPKSRDGAVQSLSRTCDGGGGKAGCRARQAQQGARQALCHL
jgi:hypothetical protein